MQRIVAGMHVIQAELAASPAARQRGLMHRERLEPNAGMLFVFEDAASHCFWMRNTTVALSIAFIGDDGRIVNIADMEPLDEHNNHCAERPVRYALEVNQGWFAAHGIEAGAQLRADGYFGSPTRRRGASRQR